MTQKNLYQECPLCGEGPVVAQAGGRYRCQSCGLVLESRAILGLFKKDRLGINELGVGNYTIASLGFKDIALPPDRLKVVLNNIYSDEALAAIAQGDVDQIRPVNTVLAQIILQQLNEECFINVNGLRRAHGPVLTEESWYRPQQKISRQGLEWQDEGNLFCTSHRLVLPSDSFTFIRLGRKLVAVQAYLDGVAVQRRGEAFATYFVGSYPHEAALVAAYAMARVPLLRPAETEAQ